MRRNTAGTVSRSNQPHQAKENRFLHGAVFLLTFWYTNTHMKIGVFDSGFGGLSILKGLVKELPQYDYIYLGDTARTPYGTRSQEVVHQYTLEAVEYLFNKDCQLVILACNTASAEALPKIQQEYLSEKYPDRRVLGVIIPACEEAVSISKGKVGIMATDSSVSSGAFERELKKIKDVEVTQVACPLLVPLVETGEDDLEIVDRVVKKYTDQLQGVDTIILGCTHYGMLADRIREAVPGITVIDEGEVIGRKTKDYLERHPEMESKLSKNSTREFLTTDLSERFERLGSIFYGDDIVVEKVKL